MDSYAAAQGRQLMATLAGVLDEVALHLIHIDDEDAERGRGEHCRELLCDHDRGDREPSS